jgi:threonine 3-dehydrogenase
MERLVVENGITWLVHNSSILRCATHLAGISFLRSASGERDPNLALRINVEGLNNMLDIARRHHLRVLAPSSIAGTYLYLRAGADDEQLLVPPVLAI